MSEQILRRQWDWQDMSDDETERILSRLIEPLRPQVPQVSFEGNGHWSYVAGSIIVNSVVLPRDFHNDDNFWDGLTDEALYRLFGQFSSLSRVYQTFWNVFPRRHGEFLRMPGALRERLPPGWQWTYGPYFQATAPTEACRKYEAVLHSSFAAEDFYYLPNTVLTQPSPVPDRSHRGDGTIGSALFGLI